MRGRAAHVLAEASSRRFRRSETRDRGVLNRCRDLTQREPVRDRRHTLATTSVAEANPADLAFIMRTEPEPMTPVAFQLTLASMLLRSRG